MECACGQRRRKRGMSSATSRYVPSLLVVLTSSIICMRLSCSTSRHFLSSPRHAKGSSKNCAAKFSYHLDLYQPPSHPPIHCAPTQRPIPQDTERNRCTRHTTLFFYFGHVCASQPQGARSKDEAPVQTLQQDFARPYQPRGCGCRCKCRRHNEHSVHFLKLFSLSSSTDARAPRSCCASIDGP